MLAIDSEEVSVDGQILLGKGMTGARASQVHLLAKMANRHGLIAGATGTGKTISLQLMAEAFSHMGVPVIMADIKGDLSGLAAASSGHKEIDRRNGLIGRDDFEPKACPVRFWDVYGQQGHPLRTTLETMGPLLISELLGLNDTQAGVMSIVFAFSKAQHMPLIDLADLRALLQYVQAQSDTVRQEYGQVSGASVGAIMRRLLALEQEGGGLLFGEPAVSLEDLMQTNRQGQGTINLLAAEKLYQSPKMYATLLMWLLSELFDKLPEQGDAEKPKLVFFFDEAHLLFDGAPKALLDKIEQVVRLIRSKGVGVYFITQSPMDIPEDVLGQLGNRIQHALRAFTPKDQKAVKVAAQTFRANPDFDTTEMITHMGVGEALVSTLNEKGQPTPVEHCLMAPPMSKIGPISAEERRRLIEASDLFGYFENKKDRHSAAEMVADLRRQQAKLDAEQAAEKAQAKARKEEPGLVGGFAKTFGKRIMSAMMSRAASKVTTAIFKQLFKK